MKVVVVGSGFAGVKTAQLLGNYPGIEVDLVSVSRNFEYHAALYRSATGRSPKEVVIPLSYIFRDLHNVNIVQDEIVGIEPQRKRVVSETGNIYSFDLLVMAVGQVANYFGIPGLQENSYSLDTITNTIELREHIREVTISSDVAKPSFAVVGAGASGVELAAELGRFCEKIALKNGLEPKKVGVTLIEGSDRVLPALSKKISVKAKSRLETLGVEVMLGAKVDSVSEKGIELNGKVVKADTVIWTAGNKNNPIYSRHSHIFDIAKNTRVEVDSFLQAREHIYVIGDSANTIYSGMAQTALHQADYVAQDIKHRHESKSRKPYSPKMPIYVVPVGPKFAVMQSKYCTLVGYPAWILRRAADFRLFAEFEPLKEAVRTWKKGSQQAAKY